MNTNYFRREVLIGVGGFVAGAVLSLTMVNWHPTSSGLMVQSIEMDRNQLASIASRPAPIVTTLSIGVVTFEDEFGLLRVKLPVAVRGHNPAALFDMPRQQPWVAPYEFLIHPDQRR